MPNLRDYASTELLHHLAAIDIEKTPQVDKRHILRLLCRLFVDPVCLKLWVQKLISLKKTTKLSEWFVRGQYAKPLQEWIQLPEASEQAEDKDWLERSRLSIIELLKPLAREVARVWLQERNLLSANTVPITNLIFLHGYITLAASDGKPSSDTQSKKLTKMTTEEVYNCARYFNFEENSLWYTELGYLLVLGNKVDSAIEAYKSARKIGEDRWYTDYSLSFAYAMKGRYKKAIKTAKRAIAEVPDDLDVTVGRTARFRLWNMCRWWSIQIQDMDGQLAACEELVSLASHNKTHAYASLGHALRVKHDWKAIYELTIKLHQEKMEEPGGSVLSGIISKDFAFLGDVVVYAFVFLDKFDVLTDIILRLMSSLEADGFHGAVFCCKYFLALFYYRYTDEAEKGILLWKDLVQEGKRDPQRTGTVIYRRTAVWMSANHLGMLAFDRLLENHTKGLATAESVAELQELVDLLAKSDYEKHVQFSQINVLLGRWYRETEPQDEKKWRQYVRPHIVAGVQYLSDETAENDRFGWRALSLGLRAAGMAEEALVSS